jgi:hypothetical protein
MAEDVGQLYLPGRTRFKERVDYSWSAAGHQIRIFLQTPRGAEVAALDSGVIELGLVPDGSVLFILIRIEGVLSWYDIPYSIFRATGMAPIHEYLPPVLGRDQHARLSILLIDAATGVLCAARILTLGERISATLHIALRTQRDIPWSGVEAFDRHVTAVRTGFREPEGLVVRATVRWSSEES